jgi:hypothetical protein
MEEKSPPLASVDIEAPFALRMMLIRRYWYLTLKFSHPFISDSERWEASWNGGHAVADTEAELMTKTLEALEDCGDDNHLWQTVGEIRDPTNHDNVILTQRLKCAFCDERERVITIYHPNPTVAEYRSEQGYPMMPSRPPGRHKRCNVSSTGKTQTVGHETMRVIPDSTTLVDYRVISADHLYISDVLGAEDERDRQLEPLIQRLHVGGLTPDEYEAERARISARAAAAIADAHDRFITRHA